MDTTHEISRQSPPLYAPIEGRTANEWTQIARRQPIPRPLFGEFWLEGETALLFGATGSGKSVLATQIAESIARGRPIAPFKSQAQPRKVLYIDLEMNEKQREMRYSADPGGDRAQRLRKHYRFSDDLHIVRIDPAELPPPSSLRFEAYFRENLISWIEKTGSRTLIVDNISALRRSFYGAAEMLPAMAVLKRLKREFGLSILVIVNTPKRGAIRGVRQGDLGTANVLSTYADSIFAIGQSGQDAAGRYVKQMRSGSHSLVYDASHLPAFTLKKIGGNFLGFEFDRVSIEKELLVDMRDKREWELIERIKKLSDNGMSIRRIAEEVGRPKSTVHLLKQMWRPGLVPSSEFRVPGQQNSEPEPRKAGPTHDFPGCEEYDAAMRDPRFVGLSGREDDEAPLLRREAHLIQLARADALRSYERTGKAPPLAEHREYAEFKSGGVSAGG